jgi:hypothetical protein
LTIERCLLITATATGVPKGGIQVDYIIGSPSVNYPIAVTFSPTACASAYTGFVSAIETTAGVSTSEYVTILPTTITISATNFGLAGIKTLRWWLTPSGNPS